MRTCYSTEVIRIGEQESYTDGRTEDSGWDGEDCIGVQFDKGATS